MQHHVEGEITKQINSFFVENSYIINNIHFKDEEKYILTESSLIDIMECLKRCKFDSSCTVNLIELIMTVVHNLNFDQVPSKNLFETLQNSIFNYNQWVTDDFASVLALPLIICTDKSAKSKPRGSGEDDVLLNECLNRNCFGNYYSILSSFPSVFSKTIFIDRIHLLLTDFISLYPFTIKKMRDASESLEDSHLLHSSPYIRFFMLLSCFYENNHLPHSTDFWGEHQTTTCKNSISNKSEFLYNFLVYVGQDISQFHVVFYLRLVKSLSVSADYPSRLSCFELLLSENAPNALDGGNITWHTIFKAIHDYLSLFNSSNIPPVSDDDLDIFCVSVELLSILANKNPAILGELENWVNGVKGCHCDFMHVLIQLVFLPTPHLLKARACDLISSLVYSSKFASIIWDALRTHLDVSQHVANFDWGGNKDHYFQFLTSFAAFTSSLLTCYHVSVAVSDTVYNILYFYGSQFTRLISNDDPSYIDISMWKFYEKSTLLFCNFVIELTNDSLFSASPKYSNVDYIMTNYLLDCILDVLNSGREIIAENSISPKNLSLVFETAQNCIDLIYNVICSPKQIERLYPSTELALSKNSILAVIKYLDFYGEFPFLGLSSLQTLKMFCKYDFLNAENLFLIFDNHVESMSKSIKKNLMSIFLSLENEDRMNVYHVNFVVALVDLITLCVSQESNGTPSHLVDTLSEHFRCDEFSCLTLILKRLFEWRKTDSQFCCSCLSMISVMMNRDYYIVPLMSCITSQNDKFYKDLMEHLLFWIKNEDFRPALDVIKIISSNIAFTVDSGEFLYFEVIRHVFINDRSLSNLIVIMLSCNDFVEDVEELKLHGNRLPAFLKDGELYDVNLLNFYLRKMGLQNEIVESLIKRAEVYNRLISENMAKSLFLDSLYRSIQIFITYDRLTFDLTKDHLVPFLLNLVHFFHENILGELAYKNVAAYDVLCCILETLTFIFADNIRIGDSDGTLCIYTLNLIIEFFAEFSVVPIPNNPQIRVSYYSSIYYSVRLISQLNNDSSYNKNEGDDRNLHENILQDMCSEDHSLQLSAVSLSTFFVINSRNMVISNLLGIPRFVRSLQLGGVLLHVLRSIYIHDREYQNHIKIVSDSQFPQDIILYSFKLYFILAVSSITKGCELLVYCGCLDVLSSLKAPLVRPTEAQQQINFRRVFIPFMKILTQLVNSLGLGQEILDRTISNVMSASHETFVNVISGDNISETQSFCEFLAICMAKAPSLSQTKNILQIGALDRHLVDLFIRLTYSFCNVKDDAESTFIIKLMNLIAHFSRSLTFDSPDKMSFVFDNFVSSFEKDKVSSRSFLGTIRNLIDIYLVELTKFNENSSIAFVRRIRMFYEIVESMLFVLWQHIQFLTTEKSVVSVSPYSSFFSDVVTSKQNSNEVLVRFISKIKIEFNGEILKRLEILSDTIPFTDEDGVLLSKRFIAAISQQMLQLLQTD